MSVRHSWRDPVRVPTFPDAAAKRQSKRISTTFDPTDEESVQRWQRKISNWSFGSEFDLLLQPTTATNHKRRSAITSDDHLTFFENDSAEAIDTIHGSVKHASLHRHRQPLSSEETLPRIDEGLDGKPPLREPYPAQGLSSWREACFIIVICLAMFTAQAGLGQVLLLLPTIGRAFDISNPGDLSWLVAGYSLTVGTFILVSGRLGDIYGYKRMVVIGYVWFALWSLVCGLSVYNKEHGYIMFVFARVLSGIGPAITMPNGLAIFGAAYPDGMRKAMAFALFGACAPSGSIVGGTFASLFELTWWPWSFFSFAVVLVVLALLCVVAIPTIPRTRTSPKTWPEFFEAVDLLGGIVGVTSLVLINFAWNQAAVVGWDRQHDYVYILLLIGLILLPCFLGVELWVAKQPLIPFSVLTGDVGFVMGCISCGWASFGVWLFYLLQIYSDLRHGSPLLISAWFSPIAVSGFAASITTGIILKKVRTSVVMVLSMSCFVIGVVLVATVPVHQSYWIQTFICSLVIPWGMDMSFPAATIIMSTTIPKEHQGVAASLVNTFVNYSISLGLGFAGTVEREVNNGGKTEDDRLRGYRGALYLAVGLAGLGLLVSVIFAVNQSLKAPREKRRSRISEHRSQVG